SVQLRLEGARGVTPSIVGQAAVYAGGGPLASDLVQRPSLGGTEDFLVFPSKPAREEVVYRVDVSAAAGLRLVGDVLEMLDEGGAPRLRMSAPYLVDRHGTRHDATVRLDDCAADRKSEGPWQRPVTRPGRPECTVRIAWGAERPSVEYPAVLDPAWTATKGTM